MDGQQIDQLARRLAGHHPRRRLLGGLVATLTTPILPLSSDHALAACKKVGRKCDKNRDCCKAAQCKKGKCKCKPGWKDCDGTGRNCVNRDRDEQHCGACGHACAVGETCCSGVCADLENDIANCGSCGHACDPTLECYDHTCNIPR